MLTNPETCGIIITEREIKEDKRMMSYEEMDLAVAAEVFGASLEEQLALHGITLEEFYEDSTEEEG